jgi:hypothetical protein
MAKQMQYTDERMVTHAESYWRVGHVNIDLEEGAAYFMFIGFSNRAASQAAKTNPAIKPIATQVFDLRGAEFTAHLSAHIAGTKNLLQSAYEIANTRELLKPGGQPGETYKFFANATDLID